MSYTTGPWEVIGASQIVKTGTDWACIAEVHNPRPLKSVLPSAKAEPLEIGHPRFMEACANAELIAAAPEMYEVCKAIHTLLEAGVLVRNTSHDHESDWAIKALPLVRTVASLGAVIAKVEGRSSTEVA